MSQKINVNIRIDKHIKEQSMLLAWELWISLSGLLNMYLLKFIRERKIETSLDNVAQSVNNEEMEKIEALPEYNNFINSLEWK